MFKTIFAATALLLSGVASAAMDPFDFHCADVVMLQAKPFQQEIGLTQAQRGRMNKHADNHRKEMAALEKQMAGKQMNPNEKILQYYNELKTNVLGELTPPQLRRLREVSLQRFGLAALCDPIVAKRIGMNAAQIKKEQDTFAQGEREFKAIEKTTLDKVLLPYKGRVAKSKQEAARLNDEVRGKLDAAKMAVAPQLRKLRSSYDARMRAIMTSSQRASYQALLGKPFTLK